MPLESDHSPVKHSVKELLFYDIDDQKSLVSDSFFVKPEYDDSYVSIIRFLCSDRNILSIFAYTLHAISFHAIVSYDSFNKCTQLIKESSIFSICIYGSDTEKSSAAANIFFQPPSVQPFTAQNTSQKLLSFCHKFTCTKIYAQIMLFFQHSLLHHCQRSSYYTQYHFVKTHANPKRTKQVAYISCFYRYKSYKC